VLLGTVVQHIADPQACERSIHDHPSSKRIACRRSSEVSSPAIQAPHQ
jgi:hypothetical protein